MIDGELLVPVMNNDEARLILGLKLNQEYSIERVRETTKIMFLKAQRLGATKVSLYRIESAGFRLLFYDPLVSKKQN